MKKTNLCEWLQHIESFHPSEIELGLDRIKQVAAKLDLLSLPGKWVLIAGTNGKGSCVSVLESLALLQGKNVACYTSPHLLEFNERVRVNGHNIDDVSLIAAFEQIERNRGDVALTFFEFTTLAALIIFKTLDLDLVILEVGLGGRHDATNIIEPDVSIITTVDKDHSNWLGEELEGIAFEKGGVVRAGRPALIGDKRTLDLLKKVLIKTEARLALVEVADSSLQKKILSRECNQYRLLEQNILLAKMAYESCFNVNLEELDIINGIGGVSLSGRFQQLNITPLTLVDVAHNPQSAHNLVFQLGEYLKSNDLSRVTVICGMMADKAIDEVLQILNPLVNYWCFVDLDSSRAITAKKLQAIHRETELYSPSGCFTSVKKAFQWINGERGLTVTRQNNELILVFGSFITVANMLQYAAGKAE